MSSIQAQLRLGVVPAGVASAGAATAARQQGGTLHQGTLIMSGGMTTVSTIWPSRSIAGRGGRHKSEFPSFVLVLFYCWLG